MWWILMPLAASAMTVDQAVSAAVARSPVLEVSQARVDEARGRVTEARGVLLPQASLTGTAVAQTRVELSLADTLPDLPIALFDPAEIEPILVVPGFQLMGGLQVVQPLVAPAGWSANAAAKQGRLLAEAEQDADRSRVVSAAVQAWHASAEAHAVLEDAQRAEELADRLVERGQGLVGVGAAPSDAVLPFQRAQATARANVALASEAAAAADGVLGLLTGLQGQADLPALSGGAPPLATALAQLDRPDLDAADQRVKAVEKQVGLQRGAALPTVAAFAGLNAVNPAPDLGAPLVWRVGVTATIPLVQGGSVAGRVDQAQARATQAEAGARAAREMAELDVRRAHGSLARSLAALGQEEESVRLATEAVAAAEKRMDQGAGSLLQLQQAQLEQVAAEARRTRARIEAARAQTELTLATRGGLGG